MTFFEVLRLWAKEKWPQVHTREGDKYFEFILQTKNSGPTAVLITPAYIVYRKVAGPAILDVWKHEKLAFSDPEYFTKLNKLVDIGWANTIEQAEISSW